MKVESLHALFIEGLQDLYDAEKQVLKALPQMAKAAQAPDLRRAFEEHLTQTEGHIDRLEQIFNLMGGPAKRTHCAGMEGLLKEGDKKMKLPDPDVRDAGMLSAAQHVEHYEIAGYGTLRTWASLMGHDEACRILQMTLDEEGETDHKLTRIAESHINVEADKGQMAMAA
jgi:ferritin-like metal-binding protein YciE